MPIAGPDKSASHLASMQRNQADEPQMSTALLITISLTDLYLNQMGESQRVGHGSIG